MYEKCFPSAHNLLSVINLLLLVQARPPLSLLYTIRNPQSTLYALCPMLYAFLDLQPSLWAYLLQMTSHCYHHPFFSEDLTGAWKGVLSNVHQQKNKPHTYCACCSRNGSQLPNRRDCLQRDVSNRSLCQGF